MLTAYEAEQLPDAMPAMERGLKPMDFEPDILVPAQWVQCWQQGPTWTPEARLHAAVLTEALLVLQRSVRPGALPSVLRDRDEVLEWVRGMDIGPISFRQAVETALPVDADQCAAQILRVYETWGSRVRLTKTRMNVRTYTRIAARSAGGCG